MVRWIGTHREAFHASAGSAMAHESVFVIVHFSIGRLAFVGLTYVR